MVTLKPTMLLDESIASMSVEATANIADLIRSTMTDGVRRHRTRHGVRLRAFLLMTTRTTYSNLSQTRRSVPKRPAHTRWHFGVDGVSRHLIGNSPSSSRKRLHRRFRFGCSISRLHQPSTICGCLRICSSTHRLHFRSGHRFQQRSFGR